MRMDRKLKERIVGAVLLVLAAVLVIPLFLDGPDPEAPTERATVALPPAEDTDARTRTVRLEQQRDTPVAPPPAAEPVPAPEPLPTPRDAPAPAPVEAAPSAPAETSPPAPAAEPAPTPAPTTPAPASEPAPAPTPTPAPTPAPADPAPTATSGEGWLVQLGSFGNRDNADRLAAELRDKRFQSFVTRHESGGRVLHRVRVGPAGTREEADALLARLAAEGYSGQAVPE